MVVLFLDLDGVLNNEGSFLWEKRVREKDPQSRDFHVSEHFDPVSASNLQLILDTFPELKIVISSTWRIHFDVPWFQAKFNDYGIDGSRVIGCTPRLDGDHRGSEISLYLERHPDITRYVVIDDNDDQISRRHARNFILTDWNAGLTMERAVEVMHKLRNLARWQKTERREEKSSAKTE